MTARTGSVTPITSSLTTFSQSITVPADATLFVLGISFYQNASQLPSSLTLGGNALTQVVVNTDVDGEMTGLWDLANPPTGSQTLAVTWASALEEGAHYFPAYYNDVDTTDPIRGTGNAGNGGSTETTGAITTAVGDIVCAVGASFGGTDCDLSATAGADQTEVADTAEFQTIQGAFGEKVGVAGTTTFTVGGAFASISAASLRDAPAGGGGTINTQTLTSNLSIADGQLLWMLSSRMPESTISLTDESVGGVVRNRLLDDAVTVTEDSTIQSTIYNILATDELTIIDEILRWARYTRLLQDDIVITDDVITSLVGYLIFTSILTSTVAVADDALPWTLFNRMLDSNVLTNDQALSVLHYTRDLLDGIDVFDELQSSVNRFILLTDTLSVNDFMSSLVVTPTTDVPLILIGFDQPHIDIGGYALV